MWSGWSPVTLLVTPVLLSWTKELTSSRITLSSSVLEWQLLQQQQVCDHDLQLESRGPCSPLVMGEIMLSSYDNLCHDLLEVWHLLQIFTSDTYCWNQHQYCIKKEQAVNNQEDQGGVWARKRTKKIKKTEHIHIVIFLVSSKSFFLDIILKEK